MKNSLEKRVLIGFVTNEFFMKIYDYKHKKILSSFCHQRWLPSLFWPEITIDKVKNRLKSKIKGLENNICQV